MGTVERGVNMYHISVLTIYSIEMRGIEKSSQYVKCQNYFITTGKRIRGVKWLDGVDGVDGVLNSF